MRTEMGRQLLGKVISSGLWWIFVYDVVVSEILVEGIKQIGSGNPRLVPRSANSVGDKWTANSYEAYPVSLPALHRILQLENKFYKVLKALYKNRDDVDHQLGPSIVKYLHRYKTELIHGIRSWSRIVDGKMNLVATLHHPFLIFQMLRRVVYDFPTLYQALLNSTSTKDRVSQLGVNLEKWPKENDVNYYGSLIVVLHHFYDFSIQKFGRGTFGKFVTGVNLSAVQSVELNYVATKRECHSCAVDFIAFAWDQATKFGGISLEVVKEIFEATIKQHDSALEAFSHKANYGLFSSSIGSIRNFTNNRDLFITKKYFMKLYARDQFPEREGSASELEEIDGHNFMSVCKGENWQNSRQRKDLKCWYKTRNHLCRYKLEHLSKNPLIIQIHGFTNRNESESLIEFAFTDLEPEGESYGSSKKERRAGLITRVGSQYSDRKGLEKLEKKIEWITGLNVQGDENGEKIQVASYIPGGYMLNHLDTVPKTLKKKGYDRIATFQIFLNKVEAGGRTGFHRLGLSIRPEMHSAVFWYNQYRNGSLIEHMIHGGCPVVLGQKWVATKWIRGAGNFFKYKCSKNNSE